MHLSEILLLSKPQPPRPYALHLDGFYLSDYHDVSDGFNVTWCYSDQYIYHILNTGRPTREKRGRKAEDRSRF